ncbi:MAG TPA: 50S ribosomal protein L13 [bacterium]|jgi:large subunit ribosomal protein L13|nr:50S ribosomal protein L13 [Dictyoglomota bacterium]HOK30092.1 50S ribosomal protein L13 [bacterium]HRR91540.1 50S ribosomal protein L13 [bacterium]
MKTYLPKKEEVERKWYVIDATDKPLGRLASKIASILRGKHKVYFSPSVDTGDFVIVINADKVKVTGKKYTDKLYYRHTLYPGGLKVKSLREFMEEDPGKAIEHAVRGMLPHNSLGEMQFKKLKIYTGGEHPHKAQQPELLEF